MKKQYVLDTNVLLHDPHSLFAFEDNHVIIPIYCIEEMDNFKAEQTDRGRNAREVSRQLDKLREIGSLAKGIKLENGGTLRVAFAEKPLPSSEHSPQRDMDSRILSCALKVQDERKSLKTALVTMDTNLRIRGDALGIATEGYEKSNIKDKDEGYKGWRELVVTSSAIDTFYSNGSIDIPEGNYHPNEYFLLIAEGNPSKTALARHKKGRAVKLNYNKKDKIWGLYPRNMEQVFAMDLLLDDSIKLVTLSGSAGCGKAQPLYSKIATPEGWKMMGDIKVGDYVYTPKGKTTKVVGVFPQGVKPIYRVHMSDDSYTDCCDDHLWLTKTSQERDTHKPGSVRALKDIKNSLKWGTDGRRNHSIPMTDPVNYPQKDLSVDPYVVGCLLGDGSLTGSTNTVSITSCDASIVEAFDKEVSKFACAITRSDISYNVKNAKKLVVSNTVIARNTHTGEEKTFFSTNEAAAYFSYTKNKMYKVLESTKQVPNTHWVLDYGAKNKLPANPFVQELKQINMYGVDSFSKEIPKDYMFGSVEQRTALLQGLMDTDGTVTKNGHVSFTTISPRMYPQVVELVQSLGMTARVTSRIPHYMYNGEKKKGQRAYTIHIAHSNNIKLFRLERKLARVQARTKYFPTRFIDRVEEIGQHEAQCIMVDDPEHLYLTDSYITTHNTLCGIAAGLHLVTEEQLYNKLLVARPVVALGNQDIGFLPGSIEEKMLPWLKPIYDNVEFLMNLSNKDKRAGRSAQELFDQKFIECEPLAYIRGRSLPNEIILGDEIQSLTLLETKTLLTRAGENTKIILSGDLAQIDTPYLTATNNGLAHVIERFKNEDIAGHITFSKTERSELAELAANLL